MQLVSKVSLFYLADLRTPSRKKSITLLTRCINNYYTLPDSLSTILIGVFCIEQFEETFLAAKFNKGRSRYKRIKIS
jgi:hypothetical protein